jgi:hypothetical protein
MKTGGVVLMVWPSATQLRASHGTRKWQHPSVMAGEGRPSMSLVDAGSKDVDGGAKRRHDDGAQRASETGSLV